MTTLLEFIEQRLTEDELWAKAASAPRWPEDGHPPVPGGVHWTWAVGGNWDPVDPDPLEPFMGGYDGRWSRSVTLRTVEEWDSSVGPMPNKVAEAEELRTAEGAHIARHDPARVLREVAAKRRLLGLIFAYEALDDAERGCSHTADQIAAGECAVKPGRIEALRTIAAVWRDHSDYDPTWSPS